MDVLSMLPLLDGWSYLRLSGSTSLSKSTELYQSDGNEQLWLFGAVFTSDVADAGLSLTLTTPGGQTITYDLTPANLYNAGRTQPNGVEPYVAKYDDTADEYEAVFSPTQPLPLSGQLTVNLVAGSTTATAYYNAALVKVDDPQAFQDSLQAVVGVSRLGNTLNLLNQYMYDVLSQLSKLPGEIRPPAPLPKPTGTTTYEGFIP